MIQLQEIDNFIKYYASIYEQNPNVDITTDSIYHGLKVYGMTNEQYNNRSIINELYNLEKSFKSSPNLKVYFDDAQPGFLQFQNRYAQIDSKCVKLYFTTTKENMELAAKEIFGFIDKNNIGTFSKISQDVRADSIVVRVPNIGEAEKVIDFINNNQKLKSISGIKNPFLYQEGLVGIGYDDLLSYNTIVSELVKNYLQDLKEKNMLGSANINGFYDHVKNYYNDTFRNCSKITEIENDEHYKELGGTDRFGSIGYAINNYEQVTRLILNVCNGSMNLENYFNFYYDARLVKKNEEFIKYYEETYKRKKDKFGKENVTQILNDNKCVELLNEYILYAYSKYGSDLVLYLNDYINGNKNAITRDNNYRQRFSILPPNMVFQITKGNLNGYVNSILSNYYNNNNSLEPGYSIFCNSAIETAAKYGYQQLYDAIDEAKKGNFMYFTNGTNNNRDNLAKYVSPNMIDNYCKYYLNSIGISENDLNRIDVLSEFTAQVMRNTSIQRQK